MIINRITKHYETRSDKPNENWHDDNRLVIEDGKELAEKVIKNYPYFDLVIENDELVDVTVYPDISYTIDTTTVATDEIATITITDPTTVIVTIDDVEYEITDGSIEYSNATAGTYDIVLKADGYKPTTIQIEVV